MGPISISFDESMLAWSADPSGEDLTVRTTRGVYHAKHLIVTAGAWAPKILHDLGLPMTVLRKVMFWFEPAPGMEALLLGHWPIYMWQPQSQALFYGFPPGDDKTKGVKVAIHRVADGGLDEESSPDSIDRGIRQDDEAALRALIADRVRSLNGRVVSASTCMYTMTPDEHFVIEQHPKYPQVCVAAGFSGHGFKLSSVVGEILADLSTDGTTKHDIELFKMSRFVHDPPSIAEDDGKMQCA